MKTIRCLLSYKSKKPMLRFTKTVPFLGYISYNDNENGV
jgi:hypothetical protein